MRTVDTDFNNVKKVIVAPQIVVYKNIFKNSKEIIDLLEKDREVSFFTKWREWYGQGFRKDADGELLNKIDSNEDNFLNLEKQYILEINKCMNFIRADYFKDFPEDNGIWPSFIKNWDTLVNNDRNYYIDFFRYDVKKQGNVNPSGLIMEYHIDEMPIPGETKKYRHVATVNFYLNNEYDGGEICVYDSTSNNIYKYKPQVGDAVIMPSTEPFYHGVRPFSVADRYFLRAFIDSEVAKEEEWKEKYKIDFTNSLINDEKSYVEKDLQTIQISMPSNLIEVLVD